MFAYCNNNPVKLIDYNGALPSFNVIDDDSGELDGQNRARIRQIEARRAERERLVVDFSLSSPSQAGYVAKGGVSFVIDLVNEDIEIYFHLGASFSNSSGLVASVGVVDNYDGPGSYSGPFVDQNAGEIIAIDHCYSPEKPHNDTVQATSISFPIWSYGNIQSMLYPSYGYGYDWYYDPLIIDLYP